MGGGSRTGRCLVLLAVGLVLAAQAVSAYHAPPARQGLQNWFNANGYAIRVWNDELGLGTFPAGQYKATLLAELAGYAASNTHGWYTAGCTTCRTQIFSGPDGPGATSTFATTVPTGFYISTPQFSPARFYYSERGLNGDGFDHLLVYRDPKNPRGYILAWEDLWGGGDQDFDDMVVVAVQFVPPNVTSADPPCPVANSTLCPVTNAPGDSRTFQVASSQSALIRWTINGNSVQPPSTDVTSFYMNGSAKAGVWRVDANLSNANGTANQSWTWGVFDPFNTGDLVRDAIRWFEQNVSGDGSWTDEFQDPVTTTATAVRFLVKANDSGFVINKTNVTGAVAYLESRMAGHTVSWWEWPFTWKTVSAWGWNRSGRYCPSCTAEAALALVTANASGYAVNRSAINDSLKGLQSVQRGDGSIRGSFPLWTFFCDNMGLLSTPKAVRAFTAALQNGYNVSAEPLRKAIAYLQSAQWPDGSWYVQTGEIVYSLLFAGGSGAKIGKGLDYLASGQNLEIKDMNGLWPDSKPDGVTDEGSWSPQRGYVPGTDFTAWGLQAVVAGNRSKASADFALLWLNKTHNATKGWDLYGNRNHSAAVKEGYAVALAGEAVLAYHTAYQSLFVTVDRLERYWPGNTTLTRVNFTVANLTGPVDVPQANLTVRVDGNNTSFANWSAPGGGKHGLTVEVPAGQHALTLVARLGNLTGVATAATNDFDGDGASIFDAVPDCDDNNKNARPGLREVPDGVDNDCDNSVDEGFDMVMLWVEPRRKTVEKSDNANYTVALRNPYSSPLTLTPTLQGDLTNTTVESDLAGGAFAAGERRTYNLTVRSGRPGVYPVAVRLALSNGRSDTALTETTVVPSVKLEIDEPIHRVVTGATAEFNLTVRNTGTRVHDYTVNATWHTENVSYTDEALPVEVNLSLEGSSESNRTVAAPLTVAPGEAATFNLTLRSGVHGNFPFSVAVFTDNDGATVYGEMVVHDMSHYGVGVTTAPSEPDLQYADPGQSVGFNITFKNTGNVNDSYTIYLINTSENATFDTSNLYLTAGATAVRELRMRGAFPGKYSATAIAASTNSTLMTSNNTTPLASRTVFLVVRSYGASLGADVYAQYVNTTPGYQNATYILTLRNLGNLNDTFDLTNTSQAQRVVLATETVSLDAQEEAQVPLFLGHDAQGVYLSNISVRSRGDSAKYANLTVVLIVRDQNNYSVSLSLGESKKRVDRRTNATYPVTFRNTGNAADTFDVDLVATTDQFSMDTSPAVLGPGESETRLLTVQASDPGKYPSIVTAVSRNDPAKRASVVAVTEVVRTVGLRTEATRQVATPDTRAYYTFLLTNLGTRTHEFRLNLANATGLNVTFPEASLVLLQPGEERRVGLTLMANQTGVYRLTFEVSTENDQETADLTLEVSQAVKSGVSLRADRYSQEVNRSENATFLVVFTNTGNSADNYTVLLFNPMNASVDFNNSTVRNLNASSSITRELRVKSGVNPSNQPQVGTYPVIVVAVSQRDGSVVDSLTTYTMVREFKADVLSPQPNLTVTNDSTATFFLVVRNIGNARQRLDLAVQGVGCGGTLPSALSLSTNVVELEPGEAQVVQVTAADRNASSYVFKVCAKGRSSTGSYLTLDSATLNLTVTQATVRGVNVTADRLSASIEPGDNASFGVTVRNTGNLADSFNFTLVSTDPVAFNASPMPLDSGGTASRRLVFTGSRPGVQQAAVLVNSATDTGQSDGLRFAVEVLPPLDLRVAPSAVSVNESGKANFTVEVANTGTRTHTYLLSTDSAFGSLDPAQLTLAPGASGTASLQVAPPTTGIYSAKVTVRDQANASKNASATVFVVSVSATEAVYGARLDTTNPAKATLEDPVRALFVLRLTNLGNRLDTFTLTATNPDPANLTFLNFTVPGGADEQNPALVQLKSNETQTLLLRAGGKQGRYLIPVKAQSASDALSVSGKNLTLQISNLTSQTSNCPLIEGKYNSVLQSSIFRFSTGSCMYAKFAEVTDSSILNSRVEGRNKNSRALVERSTVQGNSDIFDSEVRDSQVTGSEISGSTILNSQVSNSRIVDSTVEFTSIGAVVNSNKLSAGQVQLGSVNFTATQAVNLSDIVAGSDEHDGTVSGSKGNKTMVKGESSGVDMEITANESFVGGTVGVVKSNKAPQDVTVVVPPDKDFVTNYVVVDADGKTRGKMANATLKIGYMPQDLPANADQNSLVIKKWNSSLGWVTLESQADTSNRIVWANVTNFSVFAVAGTWVKLQEDKGTTLQTSGGGGGGLVAAPKPAPEPIAIIAATEKNIPALLAFEENVISFAQDSKLGVEQITIIPKVTLGNVKIEVARFASLASGFLPPSSGKVYSVLQIDAPRVPEGAARSVDIKFKVDRDWLQKNDIDERAVTLQRFHGDRWQPLPTRFIRAGDGAVQYVAESPGFSVFAVVGEPKKLKAALLPGGVADEGLEAAFQPGARPISKPPPVEPSANPGPLPLVGGVAIGIAVVAALAILKERSRRGPPPPVRAVRYRR